MNIKFLINLRKNKIVYDLAGYSLFNATEKIIPFLILPIITRILPKEEVGYFILYQPLIEILIPFLTLNTDTSILLNYYKLKEKEFLDYFNQGIFLFIIAYSVFFIISLFFSNIISKLANFPSLWLKILLVLVLFRFFTELRQNLWRVQFNLKSYGLFIIGIVVIKNIIGLFLLFSTKLGWKGLILGHLFGYFIFSIYAIYTFYKEKYIKININTRYFKDIIIVGIPITLHKIGLWLGNSANRIIIASIMGISATGNYGIGATFGLFITFIEDSFTKALTPRIFEKLKINNLDSKTSIVKISYYYYMVLILCSLIIYVVGHFSVGFIFGSQFLNTKEFILPLILAAMFKGFYKLHVGFIMFTKKTYKVTQITLTTGIINIVLAFFMTKTWGLLGAAYSMLIVTFLQYISSLYIGNKLIILPWKKVLI